MEGIRERLSKARVTVKNSHPLWLQCQQCGAAWDLNLRRSSKLPKQWWQCPNGCNGRHR